MHSAMKFSTEKNVQPDLHQLRDNSVPGIKKHMISILNFQRRI